MNSTRSFVGPNLLIFIGMLPMILWLLPLGSFGYIAVKSGNLGFSDLYVLTIVGFVAVAATVAISGAGFLWAANIQRKNGISRPKSTNTLLVICVVLLAIPLILLFAGALIAAIAPFI